MSDCSTSVTGRIDDLIVRLDKDERGRDRLLTVHPITRAATLAVFVGGRQVSTIFGRLHRGYLITSKTLPDGKRWVRLAAMLTLSMWVTGCTGSVQVHYPGKYNAIQTYEPGRTVYQGYTPPMPMSPPAADSPAWYKGMDLGLRN